MHTSLREQGGTAWAYGSLSRAPAATRAASCSACSPGHPDLEIAAVSAGSSAGKPITSIHPNLTGHPRSTAGTSSATDAATLGDAELIFMALPHGESATLWRAAARARKIVDLSADFRLGDEDAWHQFYGERRATRGRWAYGLPELPAPARGRRSRPPAPSPPPAATPPRRSSRSRRCSRPAAWSSRTTS